MLSDEEKKAIDNMKSLLLYSKEHEYFSPFQEQEIDDMNIVLNIVEKQSKEIEGLKEENKELYEIKYIASRFINRSMKQFSIGEFKYKVNNFIEWEDKIKAKIEEYKKQIEELKDSQIFTQTEYEGAIKFGQSLLEKE